METMLFMMNACFSKDEACLVYDDDLLLFLEMNVIVIFIYLDDIIIEFMPLVKGVDTAYKGKTFPMIATLNLGDDECLYAALSLSLLTNQGKEIHEYAMEGKDLKNRIIKVQRSYTKNDKEGDFFARKDNFMDYTHKS